MIKFIKNNKILSLLILLSFIAIVFGIFFNVLISDSNKEIVSTNINKLLNGNIKVNFYDHIFEIIFIGIVGISIIGFMFNLIIYLFNLFIVSFEASSLFINIGFSNIFTIILYIFPRLLYCISLFIICLYSISYSICLFRMVFRNKNYNLKNITKKYLKVLGICILIILVSNVLEIIILPRLNIIKL